MEQALERGQYSGVEPSLPDQALSIKDLLCGKRRYFLAGRSG